MKTILLLFVIVSYAPIDAFSATPAPNQPSAENWMPFSPAPVEQWGGVLTGEYDRRWLGRDLVKSRRFLFRFGYTPVQYGTLWIECGAATFDMTHKNEELRGDYGIIFGGGGTINFPQLERFGIQPFISGRAVRQQSFLKYQQVISSVTQNIDSRFVWQEGSGVIGFYGIWKNYLIHGGLKLRALFQDEFRNVKTSNSDDDYKYIFRSGVKPGAELTVFIPLRNRLSVSVSAEVFMHAQLISVTFGQWGKPG